MIGSNTVVEARGQRVRGRIYPWGIVEGEEQQLRPHVHEILVVNLIPSIVKCVQFLGAVHSSYDN